MVCHTPRGQSRNWRSHSLWILIVTLGLSVLLLSRLGLLGVGVAWFLAQASVAALLLGRFAFNR